MCSIVSGLVNLFSLVPIKVDLSKLKFHRNTSLPQETREKYQINNLLLHIKQIEKQKM